MRPMRPAKAWGTGGGGDPARLRSRHVGHLAVIGAWRFRFVSPKPLPLTTTRLASHGLKAKGGARQHPARQLTALRPATTRNANPQRDWR